MKKLLCIVGPTGVGKTALAIELAKSINGELISADSRQIYIGMDIATGKEVSLGQWQQRRGQKALVIENVPIFGLDLIRPDQEFSIFEWLQAVRPVIESVAADGKTPIIVGGTGFYLLALQDKITTMQVDINDDLRAELNQLSLPDLQQRLQLSDLNKWNSFNDSDRGNSRRLIRAIEVMEGKTAELPNGMLQMPATNVKAYDLLMIGLTMERQALYQRVDNRIEQMFVDGLIEEAKQLLENYDRQLPAMTGIGYAEAASFLAGEIDIDEAVQAVKWRNHAYIRKQYTWFKKQAVQWLDTGQSNWRNELDNLLKALD